MGIQEEGARPRHSRSPAAEDFGRKNEDHRPHAQGACHEPGSWMFLDDQPPNVAGGRTVRFAPPRACEVERLQRTPPFGGKTTGPRTPEDCTSSTGPRGENVSKGGLITTSPPRAPFITKALLQRLNMLEEVYRIIMHHLAIRGVAVQKVKIPAGRAASVIEKWQLTGDGE